MSEYTIKTVSGSVVRFDDAGDGLPLTNCEVNIVPTIETGTASGSVAAFSDGADDVPLKECTVTIMPKVEKETVSGSIVTFPDGTDNIPLKSCLVTVDSNLNGVSSVDVTQAGKNLVDLSAMVYGYVTNTGTFSTVHSKGEMRSGFISVKPNTVYYFSIVETTGTEDSWFGVGEYSEENTSSFIRRATTLKFTTRENTKFIVVSARNLEQATKIQLEVGSEATKWEPYISTTVYNATLGRTIYGGEVDMVNGTGTDENNEDFTFTPVPINSLYLFNSMWSTLGDISVDYLKDGYNVKEINAAHCSKNLLKITAESRTVNGIEFIINSDGSVNFSGTATTSTEFILGYVDRLPDTNYILTGCPAGGSSTTHRLYIRYVKGNSVLGSAADYGNGYEAKSTTQPTADRFRIAIYVTNGVTVDQLYYPMFRVSYLQGVDFGSYIEPNIHNIKFPYTIYGGTIDTLKGNGISEWDRIVYTGDNSENWALSKNGNVYRYYIVNNNVKQPAQSRGVVYSSIGTYSSSSQDAGTCFSYYTGSNMVIYYIPPQTCTTVELFKEWLQHNSLDIIYEKSTSTPFAFTGFNENTILGSNTMWTDKGSLDLTYLKDGINYKSINVVHSTKNLANVSDSAWEVGFINVNGNNASSSGVSIRTKNFLPVKGGKTIYISGIQAPSSNDSFRIFFYNKHKGFISYKNYSSSWTVPDNTCYFRIRFIDGTIEGIANMQIEYDEETDHEIYFDNTPYTIEFNDKIHGGTVDVVKGIGISKYAMAAFPDCSWSCVTSYQSNFNSTNGIISVRFGKTAMGNAGYALTTEGVVCNNFANNNRNVWNNVDRLNEIGYSDGIVINMHYSDIGLEEWTDNSSTTLAAWKSSELYLSGIFALIKATPEPFTFTPIHLTSHSSNTLWSTEGNITVSYYSYIETDGRYLIYGDTLTDIANAIREKTSIVGPINVNDFVTDIMTIDDSAPDAEEVEF